LLYAKYCGLDGCGICAESFAEYHIARGEYAIARDYIQYLIRELDTLSAPEQIRQREITEQLIERIKDHLGEEVPA
jgi:Arc/MetJ-type ribon-helix-helix transcriptional regulator